MGVNGEGTFSCSIGGLVGIRVRGKWGRRQLYGVDKNGFEVKRRV